MYQVTFIKDIRYPTYEVIHSPFINDSKLNAGVITQAINFINTLQLDMTYENRGYGEAKTLLSHVLVENIKTREVEFRGRVLDYEDDMDSEGLHTQAWMCESEIAYLKDSQQQHYEFRGTPLELYTLQINYHNSQVDDYQKFGVGRFEVEDPNDFMYVYLNAEESTLESIYRTIIDKLGGELVIRRVGGINYLDVVRRNSHDSDEDIVLSRNLMSVSRRVDATQIVTRLTPLGERIESEDEDATDASQERLTIKSVNNGIPYITHEELRKEFGIRGGREIWDDVTTASRLMTNGLNWLNNQKLILNQYKIEALDLFNIGKGVESYKVGNTHRTINPVMALDERLRIIGKTIDIVDPLNSSLTIGDKFKSLLDYQLERDKMERQVGILQGRLEGLSRSYSQIRAAYSDISEQIGKVQQDLVMVDIESLPTELQNIHAELQTIAAAIEALARYGPATPSEDGLMPALDKAKLDRISVYSSVDLNQLVANLNSLSARVDALEPPEEPPTEP